MAERSDGRLATVSYLFGAGTPSEPPVDETDELVEPSTDDSGWYSPPSDSVSPITGALRGTVRFTESPDETAVAAPDAPARSGSHPAGSKRATKAFPTMIDAASIPAGEKRSAAHDDESHDDEAPAKKGPPPVRQASITALARKGMSSAEMVSLLESREIDPDEAAAEVERLEAAGLLDDLALAEDLVETLQKRKGLGKQGITSELRRRRIDQTAIDAALETLDVDDELERAMEVAAKRASQLSSYDRQTAERRLSAFMMRRGYTGSVVSAAVAAALGPAGPRFR